MLSKELSLSLSSLSPVIASILSNGYPNAKSSPLVVCHTSPTTFASLLDVALVDIIKFSIGTPDIINIFSESTIFNV